VDNGYLWVSSYFGLCRYDGKNWTGYFDHDSGLASNFINNLKAYNTVVYVCSDRGLSTFNGKTWVTYKKNDNDANGKAIVTEGKNVREIAMSPCISNNFIIGADADDNNVWVATAHGVSHGVLLQE
jgi:ligand-binding sensor domain-containing protein